MDFKLIFRNIDSDHKYNAAEASVWGANEYANIMANHLIIGLGGTGGRVLRELRKRIYEEFRSNDPECGIYMDYIYVDSDTMELKDDRKWNALGRNVNLTQSQKVDINGRIVKEAFPNIDFYPGLKGIFSQDDLQIMKKELEHIGEIGGTSGQRRRLGRALMACTISNFEQIIKNAVSRLEQISAEESVTFYICAGLAGGQVLEQSLIL